MGDKKLFRCSDNDVVKIEGNTSDLEKHLQTRFEKQILPALDIRFLATEYVTGGEHSGRIDSLGIDENNRPVIVEYKRHSSESVLSQVLYYCDWLKKNRASFTLLVQQHYPGDVDKIDWSNIRCICIAGDYSRFDLQAVKQMAPIEMLSYREFGNDLVLLESIYNPPSKTPKRALALRDTREIGEADGGSEPAQGTIQDTIDGLPAKARELYDATRDALLELGDDVSEVPLKIYVAFKRIKNVACVIPSSSAMTVYLRIDPDTVDLEQGFSRDLREKGHHGYGDLELKIRHLTDIERAVLLFRRAYESA